MDNKLKINQIDGKIITTQQTGKERLVPKQYSFNRTDATAGQLANYCEQMGRITQAEAYRITKRYRQSTTATCRTFRLEYQEAPNEEEEETKWIENTTDDRFQHKKGDIVEALATFY